MFFSRTKRTEDGTTGLPPPRAALPAPASPPLPDRPTGAVLQLVDQRPGPFAFSTRHSPPVEDDESGAVVPSGIKTVAAAAAPLHDSSAVLESLDKVPQYTALLTGNDGRSVMRLPKEVEPFLCAIELGPQRAMILYAASGPPEVRTNLQALRSKLAGASYALDRSERIASSEVIQLIVENYVARQGGSEGRPGSITPSRSKALFESWVDYAAMQGATDIHVQIRGSQAHVHVRIHGELELIRDSNSGTYTAHMAESALGWAYNNAAGTGTNSESQFSQQDNAYCMIRPRNIGGQQIALRYQSLRGQYGPKVVCRLLNVDLEQPTREYEDLGYAQSHCDLLRHAANIPAGFLFFAGITGSGKTTSLKTFIETHPLNGRGAFSSIEDPVEYPLKGVHQINLQRDLIDRAGSAAKYGEVVAGLMRSDLDGALMGEIRDPASARAAQQIVETGHMAAGTVHAHLISSIIPRLTNDEIGMSRQSLTNPNMLTLLCYQALVPILCPHCKLPAGRLPKTDREYAHAVFVISMLGSRFKLDINRFFLRNPEGCSHCQGRGTVGLTVVAEMLMPDRQWLQLTRDGKDYEAVQHYRSLSDKDFCSPNMTGKTVFEHALYKALQGEIDPRQCERFDSFRRFEILQ